MIGKGKVLRNMTIGKLYLFGILSALSGEWIEKGLLYLFMAAVLLLALWRLNRIKATESKGAKK